MALTAAERTEGSPAHPGVFGALVRQQVADASANCLAVRAGVASSASGGESPGTRDSGNAVRFVSDFSADGSQPAMSTKSAGKGLAWTSGPSLTPAGGPPLTEQTGENRGAYSATDSEKIASPREDERAESEPEAEGRPGIVAGMPNVGAAVVGAAVVGGHSPASAAGERMERWPAIRTQAETDTETVNPSIARDAQASATEHSTTLGQQIAEAGAASGEAEPNPTATGSTDWLPRSEPTAAAQEGADPISDQALNVSRMPSGEPVSAREVPADPETAASFVKVPSPIGTQPVGGKNEGTARAAIVRHDEKNRLTHRSAAEESRPEIRSTVQQAVAVGVATDGKPSVSVGVFSASAAVCLPEANDTRANLHNNAISHALRTGGNGVAPSPDGALPAKSGDLPTVQGAEPLPSKHAAHAEGIPEHQAAVGTHRTGEAAEVFSMMSGERNSNGEATVVGSAWVGAAISSAGETGHAQGARPTAVSAPAHPETVATFDRMDTAGAPHVIESTPHRLAVGVDNGGLGWVEIHTSSAAGHVSATLTSGSAESHHAIAAQLPAVREFLAEEHVRVDTLSSERFSASSGGQRGSSGEQATDGGGRTVHTFEPRGQRQSAAAETDEEGMSYISVRV